MNFNEQKIKKFITLFKKQGLGVRPGRESLLAVLDKISVTDETESRYTKESRIISPFYYFMSKTTKFAVSLAVIALLVGGFSYFKFAGAPSAGDIAIGDDNTAVVADNSASAGSSVANKTGDADLDSLLASLDQEQSEETSLLATGDVDASTFADESSLVNAINQTYQNEL